MITPKIARHYYKYLYDISDEEIKIMVSMLTRHEKYRLSQYEEKMRENLTRPRLFLFICNLIDFRNFKK